MRVDLASKSGNNCSTLRLHRTDTVPTMVEATNTASGCTIICTPNKSMSWRQTKLFLALVIVWNLLIAGGLLLAGAWPVLPFMGLEIGGLAAALYYVQWKLSHREVIRIDGEQVSLEYGMHWPKFRYRWPRNQVKFALHEATSGRTSPWLSVGLKDERKQMAVGRNLNQEDVNTLVTLLKAAGLPVRVSDVMVRHA